MPKNLSLYIHIPFCAQKCRYCDFLSCDGESYGTMLRYVDALCKEIRLYEPIADEYNVRTIFIGGGTPSLLDESLVANILAFVRQIFKVERGAEITIEANPGTLGNQKLYGYLKAGINRLSIGLQSADNEILRKLGRIHNFDQFVASYSAARRAGFKNINIDVMSGLPGLTIHNYVDTLTKVLNFDPEHISAYSLQIEENTPLAKDEELLKELPTDIVDRRMYEITKQLLASKGFDRYEISNYAKPGYECKHNMVYWTGGEYVGFGVGSASYFQGKRFSNIRGILDYISLLERTEEATDPASKEILYNETMKSLRENVTPVYLYSRMEEFMFLGLRMTCGVSREDFKERFNKDIYEVYAPVLNKHIDQGYMAEIGDRIILTDTGIDVSNYILADFILDKE